MNRWPRFTSNTFAPDTLSTNAHLWLAFSGGPDSLCLLHQLIQANLNDRLSVVHIDHGLDSESSLRAQQANELAAQLGVNCRIERLDETDLERPGGTEAAARHARYARFQSLMSTGDYLLTAHHADDQIETMLLRLLRGSGAKGLSGMQAKRPLQPGWLTRPLLHWTQEQIHGYLEQHQLKAIEDPSNQDCSFDRNYLRKRVLPIIAERWPGYRSSLLQSSELMAAAGRALEAQAAQDFHDFSQKQHGEITLQVESWLALESVRALEVLRHWCQTQSIELPGAAKLQEFLNQCRNAQQDRQPTLDWPPAILRRWSGRIWLDLKPPPSIEWKIDGVFGPDQELAIQLPHTLGTLEFTRSSHKGPETRWQIDSGKPGDRLSLHSMSRSISELMRTEKIPPWRRAHWPRLRIDDQLVAVGDQWIASTDSAPMQVRWVRSKPYRAD